PLESSNTEYSRRKHGIELPESDHCRYSSYKSRRILVVGVEHYHDVGSKRECRPVTGLLIATVPFVLFMDNRVYSEFPCDLSRIVTTCIINQDYLIHKLERDLMICLFKSFRCIICRKNN